MSHNQRQEAYWGRTGLYWEATLPYNQPQKLYWTILGHTGK